MKKYKMRLPRGLVVNFNKLKRFGSVSEENMFNGFKEESTMNQIVQRKLTVSEILTVFIADFPLNFVDKNQIPTLYDEVLENIQILEDNKFERNKVRSETLDDLYDLVEYLQNTYTKRLKLKLLEGQLGTGNKRFLGDDINLVEESYLTPIKRKTF